MVSYSNICSIITEKYVTDRLLLTGLTFSKFLDPPNLMVLGGGDMVSLCLNLCPCHWMF